MRTRTRTWMLRAGLWLVALCGPAALGACSDLPAMRNAPNPADYDTLETEADPTLPDGDVDDEAETDDSDFDSSELPLGVALKSGEVRGGTLSGTEPGGARGLQARAAAGDFKLYNSKVAFVISGLASKRLLSPYAGAIRDLALLDAQGQALFEDPLVEAVPLIGFGPELLPGDGTLRVFAAQSATLLHNGADGRPAILRLTGTGMPFAPLDTQLEQSNELFEHTPPYAVTLDYTLAADADRLRIEMTVTSQAPADDPNNTPARPMLAWLDNGSLERYFAGQASTDLDFSGQTSRINGTQDELVWLLLQRQRGQLRLLRFQNQRPFRPLLAARRLALVGNAADMKLRPEPAAAWGSTSGWAAAGWGRWSRRPTPPSPSRHPAHRQRHA